MLASYVSGGIQMGNHYQAFYDAALSGDESRIKDLLKEGACIGEFETGSNYKNAAYQLAFEGNHAAVELIRKYGLSVDSIVRGYAQAGNHQKVEEYLNHGGAIEYVALGYAQGGYFDAVEKVLKNYSGCNYDIFLASIARGYALGGFIKESKIFCAQHKVSVEIILRAYAQAGNKTEINNYLTNVFPTLDNETKKKVTTAIANGYAISGKEKKIDHFVQRYGVLPHNILISCAIGGHEKLVNKYTNLDPELRVRCAMGYAQGGHSDLAEQGFEPSRKKYCAKGYAYAMHINKVEQFRHTEDTQKPDEFLIDIAEGYSTMNICHYDFLLFVLSHSDVNFRLKELIVSINKTRANPFTKSGVDELVKKAKCIAGFMREYQMNYAEAKVWYQYQKELMPFIYDVTFLHKLNTNSISCIISKLTGLGTEKVPGFLYKIEKYTPHEKLFSQLINKLKEQTDKYLKFSVRRAIKPSLLRKKSIENLYDQLNKIIDKKYSPFYTLIKAIGLIKGHINLTLEDHKAHSRIKALSMFTTPDLVRAYREALKVIPSNIVDSVSAMEIKLEPEKSVTPVHNYEVILATTTPSAAV